MYKYYSYSLLIAFQLLFTIGLLAQQKVLHQPLKYQRPYSGMDTRAVGDIDRDPWTVWAVLAINNNAQTTHTPGGRDEKMRLQFGDVFYVIGEEGNYLHIAKDRRPDMHLSDYAEDYGWVSKDDVLMWQRALQNPENRIDLKAMILNTTRVLGSELPDYTQTRAYSDIARRNPTAYEARLYEIFYIYKYSDCGESILLGREADIRDVGSYDQRTGSLIGWVDRNRVMEWDHRVAIEPNWETSAIEERIGKGIRTTILNPLGNNDPHTCVEGFFAGNTPNDCEVTWDHDLFDDDGISGRKSGYWRRFPVIGDYDADIYKLMVMGELTGEFGATISEDVDMEVRQQLNTMIANMRNINVVFAIDGTTSMGPFFQSVINAVQRIVDVFEQTGDEYKNLRFGYVVYRDYDERDRLTEHQQLNSNSDLIVNRLRRVEAVDLYDLDAPEAVFYGLRETFRKVFTSPDETNILIHIGDAGNHDRDDPSQVSIDEVIRLVAEYKCYYIAYQAHHNPTRYHVTYAEFPQQVRSIMQGASELIYEEWLSLLGPDIVDKRPRLHQVDENINRIEDGHPMVAIATPRGEVMDLGYLEDEIIRAVQEIDSYTDHVIERARGMLERGGGIEVIAGESMGEYASAFAPGVYSFLVRMGLDDDILRHYYQANMQFVMEGYTRVNHPRLNQPLFKPVLLVSQIELMSLLMNLRLLVIPDGSGSDRRELLYDAWISLLNRHLGERLDSYQVEEISLEEASAMVFGVPMRSTMLQQIQLKDIHDQSVFPDNIFSRYVNEIGRNERLLASIMQTEYAYSFISNDTKYYWIDVDLLP